MELPTDQHEEILLNLGPIMFPNLTPNPQQEYRQLVNRYNLIHLDFKTLDKDAIH